MGGFIAYAGVTMTSAPLSRAPAGSESFRKAEGTAKSN